MNSAYPAIDPLDWNTIQPHVDALLAAELTPARVRDWLQSWSDLATVLAEAYADIYRRITENTADEAAASRFQQWVQTILPAWERAEQALRRKWLAVPGYEPTAETANLFRQFRVEAELFRDENVPILSELRLLDKQYDEIVGGLTFTWEGETKTIPQAAPLLQSPDRHGREQVWRRALAAFLARRDDLDHLFLQMLERRRRLARNAGLPDFRAYQWRALGRFDYTPDDCLAFHEAIAQEVVPLATELYRQLAAALGLDSLRPWETDLELPAFPTVDPHPTPIKAFASTAELEETAHRIFRQVHPAFGEYFGAMRQGYLDLASRPHKAPGGYCNGFPRSRQPYIFMNAAGTAQNVLTLLHEGGHAFHFAEAIRHQTLLWNIHAPIEFAEVASMSMELLSIPFWPRSAGGFYDEDDFRRVLAAKLRDLVFFLPYMAVVDGFQHWLYAEAPETVDARDLDRAWSELWDRYLPGIDYSGLQTEKATGWHRKGHIFGNPFYYVEYGLAQLGALQVWRNALQDQATAVARYRAALALGYTRSLPELFATAGARFGFDRDLVRELMDLVREHLARLDHTPASTGTEL
jgi:oligoendopeptidase F